jgi:drug/metabolite transporter (DMT)-like permease
MLIALPPIIISPISYFVFKQKFGWQAVLVTVLAIAGGGNSIPCIIEREDIALPK